MTDVEVTLSAASLECILDPREFCTGTCRLYGNHVEPVEEVISTGMVLQVLECGFSDFLCFPGGNRLGRGPEPAITAIPDFDEYQGVIILHDQVNFSIAAMIIPAHGFQAMAA